MQCQRGTNGSCLLVTPGRSAQPMSLMPTMFDIQMILEAVGNQHLSFDLSVQPPMAN